MFEASIIGKIFEIPENIKNAATNLFISIFESIAYFVQLSK